MTGNVTNTINNPNLTGNLRRLGDIVDISTRLGVRGSNSCSNKQYFFLQNVETSSAVHPNSYLIVIRVISRR
jgi:hypothetical protein